MTKAELLLISKLLDEASQLFANHGCNDMDAKTLDSLGLDDDGKRAMTRAYTVYNSPSGDDTAEFDALNSMEQLFEFYRLPDYAWFGFMAHRAGAEAKGAK